MKREFPNKIFIAIILIVNLATVTFAQSDYIRNPATAPAFPFGTIGELYDISSPGKSNTNQPATGNVSTPHTGAKIPQNQAIMMYGHMSEG